MALLPNHPEKWDFNLKDEYGLHIGTKTVLLETAPCLHSWVQKDSEKKFKLLRAKVR